MLPEEITLNLTTSRGGGTCRKWTCPEDKANKRTIYFKVDKL